MDRLKYLGIKTLEELSEAVATELNKLPKQNPITIRRGDYGVEIIWSEPGFDAGLQQQAWRYTMISIVSPVAVLSETGRQADPNN